MTSCSLELTTSLLNVSYFIIHFALNKAVSNSTENSLFLGNWQQSFGQAVTSFC